MLRGAMRTAVTLVLALLLLAPPAHAEAPTMVQLLPETERYVPWYENPVAWPLLAAGVAAFSVGIYFNVDSNEKAAAATSQAGAAACDPSDASGASADPACLASLDLAERSNTSSQISSALLVTGVGMTAASVLVFALWRRDREDEEERVSVTLEHIAPSVTPRGGGVTLGLSF